MERKYMYAGKKGTLYYVSYPVSKNMDHVRVVDAVQFRNLLDRFYLVNPEYTMEKIRLDARE
jgi:hypothetical protein